MMNENGEVECDECRSLDVTVKSYPGMAGWASPIYETVCHTCGHNLVVEEVLYDEAGDLA